MLSALSKILCLGPNVHNLVHFHFWIVLNALFWLWLMFKPFNSCGILLLFIGESSKDGINGRLFLFGWWDWVVLTRFLFTDVLERNWFRFRDRARFKSSLSVVLWFLDVLRFLFGENSWFEILRTISKTLIVAFLLFLLHFTYIKEQTLTTRRVQLCENSWTRPPTSVLLIGVKRLMLSFRIIETLI